MPPLTIVVNDGHFTDADWSKDTSVVGVLHLELGEEELVRLPLKVIDDLDPDLSESLFLLKLDQAIEWFVVLSRHGSAVDRLHPEDEVKNSYVSISFLYDK